MTENSKKIIEEQILKLPKEIREAVNFIDWIKISEEIGKKHLLSGDEIDNLQMETGLLLVGLASFDFYIQNIENEVGTSKKEAEKIANDVLETILTPITEKAEEAFKNQLKNNDQPTNFDQNLNFILSGGDYLFFLKENKNTENILEKNANEDLLLNFLKKDDIKEKFNI